MSTLSNLEKEGETQEDQEEKVGRETQPSFGTLSFLGSKL